MAEYVELYKKYRPSRWASLYGQERMAESLRKSIVANKIPTAFLFAGPRGVGKTTSALLLAKSLNCENRKDNGDPCNKCDTCVAIDENRQMGVNYISMANKGSVDDIRSLVQEAQLSQPVKKSVWILDEVHNLSKAAFDALLIPLENKKTSALFILCSTEIDKIPTTILSRVQQRKLVLVKPDKMEDLLRKIIRLEGIETTDEVILEAIRLGRGSVRDTLSAFEGLDTDGVGSISYDGELLEALSEKNLAGALNVINKAVGEGFDGRDLAEDLFSNLRNLLLYSEGMLDSAAELPVSAPEDIIKGFGGGSIIIGVAGEIGEALNRMMMGTDARINLEVSLIKVIKKLNSREKK